MAVWQFKVTLLPQRWLDVGGEIESLFGEDGYDTSPTWNRGDVSRLESRIGTILPHGSSWSSSLMVWGSEEANDIQLLKENGMVVDLSVRFDLRRPMMALFTSVVAAAQDLELAIVDVEHKRIVPRDDRALVQAASDCSAARFVQAPLRFLLNEIERAKAT